MVGRGIRTLDDDERAVSVQVGAVILFGFIIVAMATWQAVVIPQQNKQVEFAHHERAVEDVQQVRDGIVSAPGERSLSSVTVDMAPEYPPRTLFVNPAPASGTLRTVGTADPGVNLTIANATVRDPAAADFWDGSVHTYNTGGLVYQPHYGVYTAAPATVYEHTVLYNRHETGETVTVAGQDLVDGRTVSLVTLAGNLSRTTGGSYSVDLSALSSSTRTVALTNATGNITISFASRRNASWWNETLRDELLANGGYVVDVRGTSMPGPYVGVTLELAGNTTYTLQMAKVGVGSGGRAPDESYLTDVEGDGATVPEGSTQRVVVEVRDKFNNPVPGVTVRASVSRGRLRNRAGTTDDDGRVTFVYEAPADVDGSPKPVTVNVSMVGAPSGAFDAGTPGNVTVELAVQNTDGSGTGGGDGGYGIQWDSPDGLAANGGENVTCSDDACTWDVGSGDGKLELRASNPDGLSGVNVDFATNDSGVVTVSPGDGRTGTGGTVTTTLYAISNDTATVHVAATGGSDVLTVTLINVSGGGTNAPPSADFTYSPTGPSTANTVSFAEAASDPDGNVVSYEWEFGDGTTATGPTPDHSYADDGTYTVTLTVTDDDGDTDSVSKTVTVSNAPPTASFTPDCSGDTCSFDASGSVDSDGSIVSYEWEFGDGTTGTGASPTHEYGSGGTYTVTLTVTDDDGDTDTVSTTITVTSNDRPSASLSVTCTGRECEFDASGSTDLDGGIGEYRWDFDGDGTVDRTTTGDAVVNHTFAENGTYTGTVTVVDDQGATDTASATFYANDLPTATFDWRCRGLTCTLNATNATDPDGSVTTYEWDVDGDGTYEVTTTDPTTTYRYGSGDTRDVRLRVTDDRGDTATATETVTSYAPRYPDGSTANTGSVSNFGDMADGNLSTAATLSEEYTTNFGQCVFGSNCDFRMDIQTSTSNVPTGRSSYTLAIRYEMEGDEEPVDVTIYDGNGNVIKTVTLDGSSNVVWHNVTVPASAVTGDVTVRYEDTWPGDETSTDLQVYTQRLVVITEDAD